MNLFCLMIHQMRLTIKSQDPLLLIESFSNPIIDRNTNELKQLRNQNPHRIIIGINSIRNRFESLVAFE